MDLELPPHLDSVRRRLAASLALCPTEQAPCVPAGLLEDLERHFDAPVLTPVRERRSWRERVRGLIASPAFGIAAAAMLVLSVATPSLLPETIFRGTPSSSTSGDCVPVVLVREPTGIRQLVEGSGDFEAGAVASVDRLDKGLAILGPKVVVDFETGLLRSLDSTGREFFSAPIPEDTAELSTLIAEAITYL